MPNVAKRKRRHCQAYSSRTERLRHRPGGLATPRHLDPTTPQQAASSAEIPKLRVWAQTLARAADGSASSAAQFQFCGLVPCSPSSRDPQRMDSLFHSSWRCPHIDTPRNTHVSGARSDRVSRQSGGSIRRRCTRAPLACASKTVCTQAKFQMGQHHCAELFGAFHLCPGNQSLRLWTRANILRSTLQ